MQMGVIDTLCVPEALHDVVLGGESRLIALLDGAKIPGLAEQVEDTDPPAECLFRRRDDLDDVAPWLVDLQDGDTLLRNFFTDIPGQRTALWPRSAGILFRTTLPLPALRRHLRRFLRVENEEGQPYFFRFWESHVARAYFNNLQGRAELIDRWARPREGGSIEAILVPDAPAARLWSFRPTALPDTPSNPSGSFALDASDMAAIAYAHSEKRLDDLTRLLVDTFPEQTAAPAFNLDRMTRRTVGRMHEFGIYQMDLVFVALAWELFYGPDFENADPEEHLRAILRSDLNEPDKMKALKERMRLLEQSDLKPVSQSV